jgi:hypothetical protein
MANLNDILNGLVDTDTGIIEKLKKIKENVEDNLQTSIENLENNLQSSIEDLKKGSNSYSILDFSSPNVSSSGTLVSDTYASNGKCYKVTQTANDINLFTANFSDVKYGHYGLCARMRVSSLSNTSNAIKIDIKINNKIVATKSVAASSFSSTSNFEYIYLSFQYDGNSEIKYPIQIVITVLGTSGNFADIFFDYAYINLMMPAVFI